MSLSHNGGSALFSTGQYVKQEQWFPGDAETDPYIKKTCPGAKSMNDIINEKLCAWAFMWNDATAKVIFNIFFWVWVAVGVVIWVVGIRKRKNEKE